MYLFLQIVIIIEIIWLILFIIFYVWYFLKSIFLNIFLKLIINKNVSFKFKSFDICQVMSRSWRKKKIEEDKYRKICEFFTIWQVYLFDSKLTMAIFI